MNITSNSKFCAVIVSVKGDCKNSQNNIGNKCQPKIKADYEA